MVERTTTLIKDIIIIKVTNRSNTMIKGIKMGGKVVNKVKSNSKMTRDIMKTMISFSSNSNHSIGKSKSNLKRLIINKRDNSSSSSIKITIMNHSSSSTKKKLLINSSSSKKSQNLNSRS